MRLGSVCKSGPRDCQLQTLDRDSRPLLIGEEGEHASIVRHAKLQCYSYGIVSRWSTYHGRTSIRVNPRMVFLPEYSYWLPC